MKLNNIIWILFLLLSMQVEAKKMVINFSDLEIREFVKMVSKITKKNILVTVPLSGKVDFIADHGIEEGELFTLLQSVLQSKGFTLVNKNGFLTTVRTLDASKEAPSLTSGELGQIHTKVIQIESAEAYSLSSQLRFLLSKSGRIVVSRSNNAFIITDFPRNTALIQSLIKQLDKKKRQSVKFIKLKHLKVATIFAEFSKIVKSLYDQKIVQQKVGVFKNDAGNMVILVARQEQLKRLEGYLKLLDKPDKVTKQNMTFILLKNSKAEDIKKLLSDVITKRKYPKGTVKPSVSADKELNAILIIASAEEEQEFKTILKELDRERQQVYVQAKILEISKTAAENIGVKYGLSTGGVKGGTLYNLSASLGGGEAPDFLKYATAAKTAGLSIPELVLGVNIELLLKNSAARTISEPSLLCVNNLESKFYVGKTQSILTQSSRGKDTTSETTNQYKREDIGLTLTITPRLSNDNKVSLNVSVKQEDIIPEANVGGAPTTTKSEIKTTAIVRDGELVIVGGLIRKKVTKSVSKIPLLGSIPLLGALFRYSRDQEDETNLVVILRPYILGKSEDLTLLRKRLKKLEAIENQFIDKAISNLEKDKK